MAVNTRKTAEKLMNQTEPVEGAEKVQVPAQKEEKHGGMMGLLQSMEPEIRKALPEAMRSDRMIRLALTAWKKDSKLKAVEPMTFVAAVLQASQLGLEPNSSLGECYLIPRWNGQAKQNEATFQIGYRGILSLAHRTGMYKAVYCHEVYEGDEFKYCYGLHKDIHHIPADVQTGVPKYFYAVYHLVNGGYDFVVWSNKKVKDHAMKYSKGLEKESSPWRRNFISMAKKTVLLDVLKYAPKSIEFAEQLALDNTVKRGKDEEPEKIIIDMEEEKTQQVWNEEEPNPSGLEDFLNQEFQY